MYYEVKRPKNLYEKFVMLPLTYKNLFALELIVIISAAFILINGPLLERKLTGNWQQETENQIESSIIFYDNGIYQSKTGTGNWDISPGKTLIFQNKHHIWKIDWYLNGKMLVIGNEKYIKKLKTY